MTPIKASRDPCAPVKCPFGVLSEKGSLHESTAGLVNIDDDLKSIRLDHLSLQDQKYLERAGVRQKWFPETGICQRLHILHELNWKSKQKGAKAMHIK